MLALFHPPGSFFPCPPERSLGWHVHQCIVINVFVNNLEVNPSWVKHIGSLPISKDPMSLGLILSSLAIIKTQDRKNYTKADLPCFPFFSFWFHAPSRMWFLSSASPHTSYISNSAFRDWQWLGCLWGARPVQWDYHTSVTIWANRHLDLLGLSDVKKKVWPQIGSMEIYKRYQEFRRRDMQKMLCSWFVIHSWL